MFHPILAWMPPPRPEAHPSCTASSLSCPVCHTARVHVVLPIFEAIDHYRQVIVHCWVYTAGWGGVTKISMGHKSPGRELPEGCCTAAQTQGGTTLPHLLHPDSFFDRSSIKSTVSFLLFMDGFIFLFFFY